jgi:hypothetical protein
MQNYISEYQPILAKQPDIFIKLLVFSENIQSAVLDICYKIKEIDASFNEYLNLFTNSSENDISVAFELSNPIPVMLKKVLDSINLFSRHRKEIEDTLKKKYEL